MDGVGVARLRRYMAHAWRSVSWAHTIAKPCVSHRSGVCLFNKMSSARTAPPCDFDCCRGGGASQKSLGMGGRGPVLGLFFINQYFFA
jgi:hypothetical protein